MATRRELTIAGYYAVATIGSLVIWLALALSILGREPLHGATTAWMLTGAYVAAMAWAVWFVLRLWRRLDEAAREAQKFAWFWGSIAALLLTAPVMLFFRLDALQLPHAQSPGLYFGLGWALLALAQCLCFLVAWAGWWQAKR